MVVQPVVSIKKYVFFLGTNGEDNRYSILTNLN